MMIVPIFNSMTRIDPSLIEAARCLETIRPRDYRQDNLAPEA